MSFKINNNDVIDDDRNGKFNVANLRSYTAEQLASKSGVAGQVVYCTDCQQVGLVFHNGTQWITAGDGAPGGPGGPDIPSKQEALEQWATSNGWELLVPACIGAAWGNPFQHVTTDSNKRKLAQISIQTSAWSAISASGNSVAMTTTTLGKKTHTSVTRNGCTTTSFGSFGAMEIKVRYYDINQNKYIEMSKGNYNEVYL